MINFSIMNEKELQDILTMVEDIIVDGKGDECHRVANLIRNLQIKYQRELAMTIEQIKKILEKHNFDCSNLNRVSGAEIADYVENNVPLAEPLNE